MLKYSKFAETRHTGLERQDVAMGYVEQANKVLAGQYHIDGNEDDCKREFIKARRILANLRGSKAA